MFGPILLLFVLLGILACAAIAYHFSGRVTRVVLLAFGSIILGLTFGLLIVFHNSYFDARFRTYQSFYSSIKRGMTREQVFQLVELYYPASGPRLRPKVVTDTTNRLGFFMNPEKGSQPDCEGIFVDMQSDRVVKKEYSAD